MPLELAADSAVKQQYSDQLGRLGEIFLAMYNAGQIGASAEEFLRNFERYGAEFDTPAEGGEGEDDEAADGASGGGLAALLDSMRYDVTAGAYKDDHLEFVSRVMPLIPDESYFYDAKQRWYQDAAGDKPVRETWEVDESTGKVDLSGLSFDASKGLYYDEQGWYDADGNQLKWYDDRGLYAGANSWYDEDLVPLSWVAAERLYYDAAKAQWYDEQGFATTRGKQGVEPGVPGEVSTGSKEVKAAALTQAYKAAEEAVEGLKAMDVNELAAELGVGVEALAVALPQLSSHLNEIAEDSVESFVNS